MTAHRTIAVAFREVRDRSDKAGTRPTEFLAGFPNRILSDDRAKGASSGLFKCAQRGKCTHIVYSADEDPL